MTTLNPESIKKDFPIFQTNPKLVYLDNAATTQKPAAVISAIAEHYAYRNANIHRGIYKLSEEATRRYEEARGKVAMFIGSPNARNIAFTRNATEAINLAAHGFLKPRLRAGDEILLTATEHHANIVPWHMIAKDKKAKLKFANITKDGQLDEADLKRKITAKTKLLAFAHASNVLGTINDVLLELEAWTIAKYYMKHLLVERILPAEEVHSITARAVVFFDRVSDSTQPTTEPETAAA